MTPMLVIRAKSRSQYNRATANQFFFLPFFVITRLLGLAYTGCKRSANVSIAKRAVRELFLLNSGENAHDSNDVIFKCL